MFINSNCSYRYWFFQPLNLEVNSEQVEGRIWIVRVRIRENSSGSIIGMIFQHLTDGVLIFGDEVERAHWPYRQSRLDPMHLENVTAESLATPPLSSCTKSFPACGGGALNRKVLITMLSSVADVEHAHAPRVTPPNRDVLGPFRWRGIGTQPPRDSRPQKRVTY